MPPVPIIDGVVLGPGLGARGFSDGDMSIMRWVERSTE